jgi:iron complex outermembrane recepter protein
MGGTLRVIFNKPDASKFSASVDADAMAVDGGSGGYDAQGMVNVPIITDKLAARGRLQRRFWRLRRQHLPE